MRRTPAATGRILCGTTLQCQLIFLRRNYFGPMGNIKAGQRRMAAWRGHFRLKIERSHA
ncbi:hypothetical protein [Xanthobacter autotrophicus]|uniref:hypothetical protein n=1 Tax=Xanthobacter autotrophicus TaxID=280 RepID=UPI0024A746AA|nr:hypothetical protein [Xanthobacter autotrophicus]MDI4656117.1 hypothetical protein [Xanthobacter autotrophicus]